MGFQMLVMAGHGKNVDGSFDPGAVGNGFREADLTRELRDLVKPVRIDMFWNFILTHP